MYIREFAHLFPADVAGIVLVDPAPETFYGMLSQDSALWKSMMEQLKAMPPGARAQMDVNATTVDEVKAAWPLPHVPVGRRIPVRSTGGDLSLSTGAYRRT
jgi:hypothetical protein